MCGVLAIDSMGYIAPHPTPPTHTHLLSVFFVGMDAIVDPCIMGWQILLEGQEVRRDDAIVVGKLFHVVGPIVDAFSGVHRVHDLDDVLV